MQGEFWMTYTDFLRTFTHLEVVHLDSETARDEPSMQVMQQGQEGQEYVHMACAQGKTRWSMRLYSGAWQRGVTAGGCRNNSGG